MELILVFISVAVSSISLIAAVIFVKAVVRMSHSFERMSYHMQDIALTLRSKQNS